MAKNKIVYALDVGSANVFALAGRISSGGQIEILGLGSAECRGIQQGVVVDIHATEEAIAKAIKEVNLTSGTAASNLYVSSGGTHIVGRASHGTTAVRAKEVSREDVEAAINAAKAISFPQDEMLMHILPQNFSIDRQENIREPLGMSGMRLEVDCYLISGLSNTLRNIQKCVSRCNISIKKIVVEQIADSYGCLTQDEQEAGVCLVNIGAGSTKFIVVKDNAPLFIKTLPISGENVTIDISTALRIPTHLAEDYKKRYGCANSNLVDNKESISIPRPDSPGVSQIGRQNLASFIQPRYEEIFEYIMKELTSADMKNLIPGGVVLAGGGARIEGIIPLAAEIMHCSTRVGTPQNLSDNSDYYALVADNSSWVGVCGLLSFAFAEDMQTKQRDGFFSNSIQLPRTGWFSRVNDWVGKNF